jgi:hypothetical protein
MGYVVLRCQLKFEANYNQDVINFASLDAIAEVHTKYTHSYIFGVRCSVVLLTLEICALFFMCLQVQVGVYLFVNGQTSVSYSNRRKFSSGWEMKNRNNVKVWGPWRAIKSRCSR